MRNDIQERSIGSLVAVAPQDTGQTCSAARIRSQDTRSGERFDCAQCGLSLNADVNAVINTWNLLE